MSIAAYCKCRIQYTPHDQQYSEVIYSDRSLIELRQNDFADYSLRAIDIDNKRAEIFNIPFKKAEQFKRGQHAQQPDAIRTNEGVYFLWLNAGGADTFYEALAACIEETELCSESQLTPQSPPSPPQRIRTASPTQSTTFVNTKDKRTDPPVEQNDILMDVYRLGQLIREGDIHGTVDLSKKLAGLRIPLQAKECEQLREEQAMTIRIKIDSNDETFSSRYREFSMNVYPLTTVSELRTSLEYSKYRLPSNQYLFVNGHLAHDNSTMRDLNVQSNSLFISFIIQP